MFIYAEGRSSLDRIQQNFPKQTKSQTLLRLYLFWKNRIVQFNIPDGPVFTTSTCYFSSILVP
jgi:hypothetical protein